MVSQGRRLLAGSLILAAVAVTVAVWTVSAYRYAATTRHWPSVIGTVVATGPASDSAAVRFADTTGRRHLMPLATGDTDDLPVGSVIRVSYQLAADGRVSSEFRVQPGARASALATLAGVAAAGSAAAAWRWRATRRQGH